MAPNPKYSTVIGGTSSFTTQQVSWDETEVSSDEVEEITSSEVRERAQVSSPKN